MNTQGDVFEDRPMQDDIGMIDWTGTAWVDLPPERVQYLTQKTAKTEGRIMAMLSQVPVGEGRKRENFPNYNTAKVVRNSLYRAAKKVWGTRSVGGKSRPNIRTNITHNEENDTYGVEFIHLAPENDNSEPKAGKPKAWKKAQTEEQLKDELYMLCLKYATPTITAPALYNLLRHGEISTIEDLRRADLNAFGEIRYVGPEKLAVIVKMKEGLE